MCLHLLQQEICLNVITQKPQTPTYDIPQLSTSDGTPSVPASPIPEPDQQ